MEIQFLFLPFIGYRDNAYNFHASGYKYSPPAEYKSCKNCIRSHRVEFRDYKKQINWPEITISTACNKHIVLYTGLEYQLKHPCDHYFERMKLKKL